MASRNSAVSWQVNALVEATPISGPACVISVPAASRVIMEPTTLQMASVFEPFCLASRWAASVSAVSPDCEITTVSVSWSDDRIAVAELAAVVHFHGDAGQPLDHEFAGQRRMPAGAAGDDAAPGWNSLNSFGRDVHLVQEDAAGFLSHAAQRGVAHGARLLKNFLEHEMLVAALFRHDRIPQNVRDLALHGAAVEVGEVHAVAA